MLKINSNDKMKTIEKTSEEIKSSTAIVEKSWHFDSVMKQSLSSISNNNQNVYSLIPVSAKDFEKVFTYYQHHPVAKMDIASVEMIYNPDLNRAFELRLGFLQQRDQKFAFAPKWSQENDHEWRAKINDILEKLAAPYKDIDYPMVKILPLWHGTKPSILQSLFETGYANLATTDSGFFGKGIYGAYEAEYAYRVYSQGVLILNWAATFSAYPTIAGDMDKLKEKGNYQNYDAHFVPVIPPNGQFSNQATVYFPCQPNQQHQYIEMVVFESAQCLPRYLVKLQPSLPKAPASSMLPNILSLNLSNENPSQKMPGEEAYEKGYTLVLKNNQKGALPYFEQAANEGYPAAYLSLGWLYASGEIGFIDKQKSQAWYVNAALNKTWFEKQANSGNPEAQKNLGFCYSKGIGVSQDIKQAADWYQKAAEQGLASGQVKLGSCYANGSGVVQDHKQAADWYQKAAEQGNVDAQYLLGGYYMHGIGVIKDEKQGVAWYHKAAEQNDTRAQCELADCYLKGYGVVKDEKQGMAWYHKAAEQNNASAQCRLGARYEYGKGTTKDTKQAMLWYCKAAEQGNPVAKKRLDILLQENPWLKNSLGSNTQSFFAQQSSSNLSNNNTSTFQPN